jgi:hypothetical protein
MKCPVNGATCAWTRAGGGTLFASRKSWENLEMAGDERPGRQGATRKQEGRQHKRHEEHEESYGRTKHGVSLTPSFHDER